MIIVFLKSLILDVKAMELCALEIFRMSSKKSSSVNLSKPPNHQLITAVEFAVQFSHI